MPDIRGVLSEAQLERFRRQYDAGSFLEHADHHVVVTYPPAGPRMEADRQFFTQVLPLSVKERERIVIALLAEKAPEMSLAVHCYWGLMEGLSVDEIAAVLWLVGIYAGMPVYLRAVETLTAALHAMRRLSELDGQPLDAATVMTEISSLYMDTSRVERQK